MGHSFLSYRDKHSRLSDTDIEVAEYMMEDFIQRKKSAFEPEMFDMVSRWHENVKASAPGCIDLNLDSLINDNNREMMLAFLDSVGNKVNEMGEKISASLLNSKTGVKKILFLDDYEVKKVLDTLSELKNVLSSV